MSREVGKISARNKQEALLALDMLKKRILNTHCAENEPVCERVLVTNEGKA